MTPPSKEAYSIAAYIPNDHSALESIKELARQYSLGTKLFVLVPDNTMLKALQNEILSVITSKGLAVNGLDLEIDFTGDKKTTKMTVGDSFNIFNCAAYVIPDADPAWKHCSLINGEISSIEAEKILREADRHTNFNFDQYLVEHANIENNVIVRAGAGTGKTHTMISRIAFVCANAAIMPAEPLTCTAPCAMPTTGRLLTATASAGSARTRAKRSPRRGKSVPRIPI